MGNGTPPSFSPQALIAGTGSALMFRISTFSFLNSS